MIGEQCSGERRTKLQPPHDAVAAVVPSGAARAAADRELPHQHRELALQDLRVRETRVGHVSLHGVAAIEIGARAGAAGDGFVVLQVRIPEGQVVHGALGGGENSQRAVQRIDDAL